MEKLTDEALVKYFMLVGGLLLGMLCASAARDYYWKNEACKRGYAIDGPYGFQWKEPINASQRLR